MYLTNTGYSNSVENITSEIIQWSLGKEKFLNIIAPPYNTYEIFVKIILEYISRHKKVLYITDEELNKIHIISSIKKEGSFRDYVYFKENSYYEDAFLLICKHHMLDKIKEKYDLVIYDDIRSFSFYTKDEIAQVAIEKCKSEGKVIAYSIEKIFNCSRETIFPVRANYHPMAEPKVIATRIDINRDIPYVIYEYLEWLISGKGKVVVYAPDKEKTIQVHKYLSLYCSKFTSNILKYTKDDEDKSVLYKFINTHKSILVTNHFRDIDFNINNLNAMVFFADDNYFDYKKLTYLCGKVGRSISSQRGEVIFLANYESEDMDKAKNIIRHFNKEAWEMNLLKI